MTTWRLIHTEPALGAWNMALDEAIMEAVARGDSAPTLRFFAWKPACLSLGYAQRHSDADLERLAARGWVLVRRPTGGRAILHTDELTYSVIAPTSEPRVAGSILESYRRLSGGLAAGLARLGLQVETNKRAERAGRRPGPICFEVPSDYEITVGGRKLLGSAQKRTSEVVLQHGSLPLVGDLGRICDGLVYEDADARAEARDRVYERAVTVKEVLGRVVTWAEAAQAITEGFAEALDVILEGPISPTADERARAEALVAEKYGTEAWNARRR